MTIFFTVQAIDAESSFVIIDYYLKKEFLIQLYFSLFLKNKLCRQLSKSLNNLEELSKQSDVGYIHPA